MITDARLEQIAREGTPAYVYDMQLLRETLCAVRNAADVNPKFRVHYAMKANCLPQILHEVKAADMGLDTVSGGEIRIGLDQGFAPRSIVFAGVGKSDPEIDLALNAGIGCFNVESVPELEIISQRAVLSGKTARVALRVNPDIDAHTHHYITTGLTENKFGINLTQLERTVSLALSLPGIHLIGLHFHIGSQITILEPFRLLCDKINSLVRDLHSRGVDLKIINVGGGLAINYEKPLNNPISDFKAYFDTFNTYLDTDSLSEVHFELGRSVVGQCGLLVSRVIYLKQGDTRNFAIIDAGMNNLIRPALYQARHAIRNITALPNDPDRPIAPVDVVGPICESADVFGQDYLLPLPRRGDTLVIYSAGAYGQSMSSQYNSRTQARTVFV